MNPIIIVARIIFPLIILKFPLVGGVVAIWLDNVDWHTKLLFGVSPIGDYQLIDKVLDLYYFSLLAIVTTKFKNRTVKHLILGLFAYRLIGIILFEITNMRWILFMFPNIFENLFFFYYIVKTGAGYEPKISYPLLGLFFSLLLIPKMMHEYSIHIIQKPLILDIFRFSYTYEGTNHQILFIVILAMIVGFLYRRKKYPRQ